MNDTEHAEVLAIAKRINRDSPAAADIKAYKALLVANPHMWRHYGDLAMEAAVELVVSSRTSALWRESVVDGIIEYQCTLGWKEGSPIEQLLIDQVVLCWLRQNLLEDQYTTIMHESHTLDLRAHYDRLLTNSQQRYMRAIETLARVRRLLKTPGVQITVALEGGQQVNQVVHEWRAVPVSPSHSQADG